MFDIVTGHSSLTLLKTDQAEVCSSATAEELLGSFHLLKILTLKQCIAISNTSTSTTASAITTYNNNSAEEMFKSSKTTKILDTIPDDL